MINKVSNLKLILGLVLLGLIYLGVEFFDKSKSTELEKELVSMDTSKVSQVTLQSSQESVELYRASQGWEVALTSGKRVVAVNTKVTSLLNSLSGISTDRLAAKEEDKWGDYQVDSAGTKVQVREGDKLSLDMVVGESGSTSYIRLTGESEVYASDNFKGLRGLDQINNYRDNTFIKLASDSVVAIRFDYPGDSSFQVIKQPGQWNFEDGTPTDSVKTAGYLKELGLKYNDNFAVQDGSALGMEIAKVTITLNNQTQIDLTAFSDLADSVIYHSSINNEAYFNDGSLGETFFIGKETLMPAE